MAHSDEYVLVDRVVLMLALMRATEKAAVVTVLQSVLSLLGLVIVSVCFETSVYLQNIVPSRKFMNRSSYVSGDRNGNKSFKPSRRSRCSVP